MSSTYRLLRPAAIPAASLRGMLEICVYAPVEVSMVPKRLSSKTTSMEAAEAIPSPSTAWHSNKRTKHEFMQGVSAARRRVRIVLLENRVILRFGFRVSDRYGGERARP